MGYRLWVRGYGLWVIGYRLWVIESFRLRRTGGRVPCFTNNRSQH